MSADLTLTDCANRQRHATWSRRLLEIVGGTALGIFALATFASPASASDTLSESAQDAHVYIGWPNDGEIINRRKFRLWFGLRNMGVTPAGTEYRNGGHHHLLIDTELPPLDEEIPADKNHRHFGAGQTEAVIELEPGVHTLQLLMGDHNHVPHNPPVMSKKITITIK